MVDALFEYHPGFRLSWL